MKVYTQETLINIYDENDEKISTKRHIAYLIYPAADKVLYDKKNRQILKEYVCVGDKSQISNYDEVDAE